MTHDVINVTYHELGWCLLAQVPCLKQALSAAETPRLLFSQSTMHINNFVPSASHAGSFSSLNSLQMSKKPYSYIHKYTQMYKFH